ISNETGLAASNLEELLIVNIYNVIMLRVRPHFLVLPDAQVFGEIGSILFTFLISIFRYQKRRDAEKKGNLPVFLDNIWLAWAVSGLCVMLAMLLGTPTYLMNLDGHMDNYTHDGGCPPDFFQCPKENCLTINLVLLGQRRVVVPALSAAEELVEQPPRKKGLCLGINRNTVGILDAMGLFQVEWILYLVLHLAFSPYDFPFWTEGEFFITTSYTTISPYVYGIGSNPFPVEHFKK
ncbi:unnamed protein product, partial [Coregonus sp. 'balchen']